MKLRVLDLFSGIGGFSYGLEQTGGFHTAMFVEIDKECQLRLRKNWPEVPIIDDVRAVIGGMDIPHITRDYRPLRGNIDLICGGFPCQDISVAGLQKGITNGTRSGLWTEYKRIIKEVCPRWIIIENVRNLLNKGLAVVVKDLHEVGYDCCWEIISARSVGACHLRERIWIVAYPHAPNLREQSGRRSGKKGSGAPLPRIDGQEGITDVAHTMRSRLQGQRKPSGVQKKQSSVNSGAVNATNPVRVRCSQRKGLEKTVQSKGDERLQRKESEQSSLPEPLYSTNSFHPAHSNNFRFWPSFTTEEEKSKWWTEATSSFRDWWEIESTICRVDDGLSPGLDKGRAQRIKQLGNAIVPQIAELIGYRILHHETQEHQ